MKGGFMRDLVRCWLDITPAPIPSQKNQLEGSSQSICPQMGHHMAIDHHMVSFEINTQTLLQAVLLSRGMKSHDSG